MFVGAAGQKKPAAHGFAVAAAEPIAMHAPGAHVRHEKVETKDTPPVEYLPALHALPAATPVPAGQKAPGGHGACVVLVADEFVHT